MASKDEPGNVSGGHCEMRASFLSVYSTIIYRCLFVSICLTHGMAKLLRGKMKERMLYFLLERVKVR